MGAGYPINWALPVGSGLEEHPLYIKYSSLTFGEISVDDVIQDLGGVTARADTVAVCAYLSWLIRTNNLMQPAP